MSYVISPHVSHMEELKIWLTQTYCGWEEKHSAMCAFHFWHCIFLRCIFLRCIFLHCVFLRCIFLRCIIFRSFKCNIFLAVPPLFQLLKISNFQNLLKTKWNSFMDLGPQSPIFIARFQVSKNETWGNQRVPRYLPFPLKRDPIFPNSGLGMFPLKLAMVRSQLFGIFISTLFSFAMTSTRDKCRKYIVW